MLTAGRFKPRYGSTERGTAIVAAVIGTGPPAGIAKLLGDQAAPAAIRAATSSGASR